MRLYCLASISRIPPDENYVEPIPYDPDAEEMVPVKGLTYQGYLGGCDEFTLKKLPSDYRLTEICIGYKTFEEDKTRKIYDIEIYQTHSNVIGFRMLRSFVTITYMDKDNGCFDLYLATSKLSKLQHIPDFDLKIRVFCIRNTTTKGNVTIAEELAYNNYAKQINDFWSENPEIKPENLRMEVLQKFGPLDLPNPSTLKVFKQRLKDFQTAVHLLCDPKTGSYKNVGPTILDPDTNKYVTCRFYQEVICLLCKKESTWHAELLRNLKDTDKFRDCISLRWKNITLNNQVPFSVFNFQNLKDLQFEKVHFGTSMEYWYKLAEKINFEEINFICLRDCGIKRLDDKFFKHLTPKLGGLRLMDNDITFISKEISKLSDLHWLDLNGNKHLTEDGIPWGDLPSSIGILNLFNTDIGKIPKEIWKIKRLRELNVSSCKLNHIEWTCFRDKSSWGCGGPKKLHLYGSDTQINDVILRGVEIDDLMISHLKFSKFEPSRSSFSSLHLTNNGLKNFNMSDINFSYLRELTISRNGLKTFSWKQIPNRIRRLNLSYNQLKKISALEDGEIDFSFFDRLEEISFEGNAINFLPKGFENLPTLKKLNLSFNYFGCDGADLLEVLWHRLPKSLTTLNVICNKIDSIPCYLKNLNIQNLFAAETNLHHICPYLHTNVQKNGNYMVIDARYNSFLKHSFIPNTIYQLPKADIQPTIGRPLYPYGDSIPNYANFPTTTIFAEEKDLRDTSRTKYNNKNVYKFITDGVTNSYACKCCAICGDEWHRKNPEPLEVLPLFEQQMAPDSILLLKKEKGVKDSKYANFHSPFQPPIYFEPGQWRTKITSRLCVGCKDALMAKIDAAFEKFAYDEDEENNDGRKKKKNVDKTVDGSPPASQQQTFYNHTEPGPSSSSTSYQLPSINTLLPNQPQDFYHQYIDPHPMPIYYQQQEPMEYEENSTFGTENFSFNENYFHNEYPTNPPTYSIPQATILLDQEGNQICSWNAAYPIVDANMPMDLTLQGYHPSQETFQYLPTINPDFHQQHDSEVFPEANETLEGQNFLNL